MQRTVIAPETFDARIFELFNRRWLLLAAGSFKEGKFNVMTVSWGFLGFIWQRPATVAVVRPQRHTLQFMTGYDSFTLSAYPETMREALNLCGTASGREIDKVAAAGLTPEAARTVDAPAFAEAELVIECRQLYRGELTGEEFLTPSIPAEHYPDGDYHKVFVGEVTGISGTDAYR